MRFFGARLGARLRPVAPEQLRFGAGTAPAPNRRTYGLVPAPKLEDLRKTGHQAGHQKTAFSAGVAPACTLRVLGLSGQAFTFRVGIYFTGRHVLLFAKINKKFQAPACTHRVLVLSGQACALI